MSTTAHGLERTIVCRGCGAAYAYTPPGAGRRPRRYCDRCAPWRSGQGRDARVSPHGPMGTRLVDWEARIRAQWERHVAAGRGFGEDDFFSF